MTKQIVSKAVGIDLGTTNSKVAVMNPTDTEIVLHQDKNTKSETTPSCVWKNPETGEVVVGRKALVRMGSTPPPIRSIKRLMGQQTKVKLTDEELAPEEVSAHILREMKRQIEEDVARFSTENTKYVVDRAIITVPAYFDQDRVDATRRAGELAGLEVLELLHEPTASACYYCWKHNIQNGLFLVYDLGGGTLDVTVLRCTEGAFEVLGISGNIWLGGDNMDKAIAEKLRERLVKEGCALELDLVNEPEDKIRFDKLKFLSEGVKKALSTQSEFMLMDSASIKDKNKVPVTIESLFERSEIEAIIRPIVEQTIPYCFDALEQAEKKAGIKLADVDAVILAGGPTHIPLVQEIVRQNLCSPISENIADPRAKQPRAKCTEPVHDKVDVTVAFGAAIRAAATGGLFLYDPEKTVRVYFSGIGVTDRKETFAGGRVTVVDPAKLDLTGGYIKLSIPDIGYKDECDLNEGGAFRFKFIPLQPSAENLLTFEVFDRDGSLIVAVDRQIKQSEETVRPTGAGASTAVLSKTISLEVEREGKIVLKELIKALEPLPTKAVFYFTHPGETNMLLLPMYQRKRKIQEIRVKVPSSLPKGTPIEFNIEVDKLSFITIQGRVSETTFEAKIEQPPDRGMPTNEEVQSLERSFREVLEFLPAGRRQVEEAKYKMTKKSFEAAAKSGEKEQAVNYFEEMEALVAELSQGGGQVQPPKEFFDAAVRKCYELNQWLARAAAMGGVLYDDIEMAKQIDAQRVQGEGAFEAGNQKAYSDAIMMLENIQGYIIQFARDNDLIKGPKLTQTERARLTVKTAEEEAAEITKLAISCQREDLKDEANQIKNKLNELKAEIQTNPDGVLEKASQIRVRLEQMNNELMGTSKGEAEGKHPIDSGVDRQLGFP